MRFTRQLYPALECIVRFAPVLVACVVSRSRLIFIDAVLERAGLFVQVAAVYFTIRGMLRYILRKHHTMVFVGCPRSCY